MLVLLPRAVSRLGNYSSLLSCLSTAKTIVGSVPSVRNTVRYPSGYSYDTPQEHKMVPFFWVENIAIFAALCKVKKYPIIISAVAVPISLEMYRNALFEIDVPIAVCGIGVTFSLVFALAGSLCNHLVAGMYVKEDGSKVKIVFMDSSGNRKDVVFPTEDLVPLVELPTSFFDRFYIVLRRRSCNDTYKTILRPEYVLSQKLFKHVFKTVI